MKDLLIIAVCLFGLTLSACSTPAGPNEYGGTMIGAGGGALAGGLIGAGIGGPRGALLGAGLGAVAGGLVGKEIGKSQDSSAAQKKQQGY